MNQFFCGEKKNEKTQKERKKNEKSFVKGIKQPDLLGFQIEGFKKLFSYEAFYKEKNEELLYKILKSIFPIKSKDEKVQLDFVDYVIEEPIYSYIECIDKELSYTTKLTIKFKLEKKDEKGEIECSTENIYIGEIPIMTEYGTFIYNGIERVGISQLKKVIGISFFCENNKKKISNYICRIIPLKGNWIEFTVTSKGIMHICFDKKNKFLLSTFLRAIGFKEDKDILSIFTNVEKVNCTEKELEKNIGKTIVLNVVENKDSNINDDNKNEKNKCKKKILIKGGTVLTREEIDLLLKKNIDKISILETKEIEKNKYIINTLNKDNIKTEKEAQSLVFKSFNPQEKMLDDKLLAEYLKNKIFNIQNYDLGDIGREKINSIIDGKEKNSALTVEDITKILKHFIKILNKEEKISDVDHFENKKVATISEQMYDQFVIIFSKIAQHAKKKMNILSNKDISIFELINNTIFFSLMNSFFATNPFVQFMDEMNPLAEMMHKRRVSVIGVNGISKESKTINIRDIHYSQYGKICLLETPEGEKIGLVTSLASFAKIDERTGFIKVPYRKVENGKINLNDDEVVFLNAGEEKTKKIAMANTKCDENGEIIEEQHVVRFGDQFKLANKNEIDYIEVDPGQAFSMAASMIPFIENDEASRAMLGINMQKQSVPILGAEQPIVGTGKEKIICKDSRRILYAENDGVVEYVDANKIKVKYEEKNDEGEIIEKKKEYEIIRMKKGNQKLAINYNPIVKNGQKLKKGDVLTEGFATKNGEIALGANLKVAFMTWKGYNYEDAIIISDRLVKEDILTSIFIEKYDIVAKETKLGKEELTKDLNILNSFTEKNLDDNGLIKEGLFVKSGDVIVGKTTPISTQETTTTENKILKAIFGLKAQTTIDSSLTVPPFVQGTVIKSEIFQKNKASKKEKREANEKLIIKYNTQLMEFISSTNILFEKLLLNKTTNNIVNNENVSLVPKNKKITKDILEKILSIENQETENDIFFSNYEDLSFYRTLCFLKTSNWTTDPKTNKKVEDLIKETLTTQKKILNSFLKEKEEIKNGNPLPFDVIKKAEITIAEKRKIKCGDKLSGRHGNKGVISKILREEDMPFLEDGTPIDIILTPLGIPSRMNLGQLFETILGFAGKKMNCKYEAAIFNGHTIEQINDEIKKANLPTLCKMAVYDGQTGEKFANEVTVGFMYILKLNHMVEDKIHARSIGKYSLVSQQPLKGRVNFGGQRFGEMECWALEAYGATNILQELMTIKSDDINGRRKTYENIINGNHIAQGKETDSFNTLMKEMRAVGIKVTLSE